MKGKDALIQQLIADGLTEIFGNPGSTEEGILDAIGRNSSINYVLGLQEASVMAMADGWARVKRKPAVVQLHAAVGLGNGMGVMYEANRSHTPLLVIACETYLELQAFDGFLGADLVEIAKPLTKWSARVTHGSQLLRMVRRAIKVASSEPQGPVFLALPMNVLDEDIQAEISASTFLPALGACSDNIAESIAEKLVNASFPMLLIGDGVAAAGAQEELLELANLLACPTWGVEFNDLSASFTDPMFLGVLSHSFGINNRKITKDSDVILGIGTPLFPELFPSLEPYFKSECQLMQIDSNPWELAKNFPSQIVAQADPKLSLNKIVTYVKRMIKNTDNIEKRRQQIIIQKRELRKQQYDRFITVPDLPDAMSPNTMMKTLVEELPKECLVYDESITCTLPLQYYLQPAKSGSYILARGGCIGVGWPGAIGASFAEPNRTIIASSADGSALFAIQCLWTAVRYSRKIIFIVCNNSSYRILKINILNYWQSTNITPIEFPFMDLHQPSIDFSQLAAGFGMPSSRVSNSEDFKSEIKKALSRSGPSLIDVVINGALEK